MKREKVQKLLSNFLKLFMLDVFFRKLEDSHTVKQCTEWIDVDDRERHNLERVHSVMLQNEQSRDRPEMRSRIEKPCHGGLGLLRRA